MASLVRASLVTQSVKKTQVWSLGWEDPLEKEMATHSSILAWEIPWTEEPGGLQSMGSERLRHDLATKHHHHHPNVHYSTIYNSQDMEAT